MARFRERPDKVVETNLFKKIGNDGIEKSCLILGLRLIRLAAGAG